MHHTGADGAGSGRQAQGVRPQQGAQLSPQHLVQAPEDVRWMQAEIEWDRGIVHNLMRLRHPDV